MGVPDDGARWRHHLNAINGADRDAESAACAVLFDHGMHTLEGACNGVDGTGLQAEHAADAILLSNSSQLDGALYATGRVERDLRQTGDGRQGLDARVPPRGAAVDVRQSRGHSLRIGPAGVITATPALGLWKDLIDRIHQVASAGSAGDGTKTWRCAFGC